MSTRSLSALSADECRSLLRQHPVHVGRLAVVDADGRPLVMPVNYRLDLDGDAVIVRTQEGSLLAECAQDQPVAFEIDEVDEAWQEGWSVLVQGRAQRVTDPDELDRLQQLPLHPWAPGERGVYLRIPFEMVTGRRIE